MIFILARLSGDLSLIHFFLILKYLSESSLNEDAKSGKEVVLQLPEMNANNQLPLLVALMAGRWLILRQTNWALPFCLW